MLKTETGGNLKNAAIPKIITARKSIPVVTGCVKNM